MSNTRYNTSTITIMNYKFDGPYTNTKDIREASGIYVILDRRADGQWYILDVGESSGLQSRIINHDRKECWIRNKQGVIGAAILYTPTFSYDQRRQLESSIRNNFTCPCGER